MMIEKNVRLLTVILRHACRVKDMVEQGKENTEDFNDLLLHLRSGVDELLGRDYEGDFKYPIRYSAYEDFLETLVFLATNNVYNWEELE